MSIRLDDSTEWRLAQAVARWERERAARAAIAEAERLVAPLRANTPRAGDAGYEPGTPPDDPHAGAKLALCVMLVCGMTLAGLALAVGLWANGVTLWG